MTDRMGPGDTVRRGGNREGARRKRILGVWFALASAVCVAAGLALWPLVSFVLTYGASFDVPGALPLPEGSTAVVSDEGADDDDPMRSRQQVVDVPVDSPVTLPAFYRRMFPVGHGWSDLPVDGDQQLCLVNRTNDEYIEVVEVFAYTGSRVPVRPGRQLVMTSRFQHADDPCGMANIWIASDLF